MIPLSIESRVTSVGFPSLLFTSSGAMLEYSVLYPRAHFTWRPQGAPPLTEPRPGRYCFLNGLWSEYYWHWMLEYLPRVLIAEQFSPTYIIWERAPAFVRESLELLRIPSLRILPVGESPLSVEEAVIIEPVTGTAGHGRRDLAQFPQLLSQLREGLLKTVPPSPRLPGIFISRRSAKRGRGVLNESEVIEYLKGRGVTAVLMETLSLRDQLSLLQGAASLYGPHGAGILNALFMQPGSKVVEFLSTLCPTDTNALIMRLLGHTHLQIVSETPVSRFEDPFEIKVERIP